MNTNRITGLQPFGAGCWPVGGELAIKQRLAARIGHGSGRAQVSMILERVKILALRPVPKTLVFL